MLPFTFQYVSIISDLRTSRERRSKRFTFQYVSIISKYSNIFKYLLFIYIPICFYYFLFSISTVMYGDSIYIPICFYYFQIQQYIQISVVHLHSNMFLLFRRQFRKRNSNPNNLHSNMFLLFPKLINFFAYSLSFTFQYVSIISCSPVPFCSICCSFTFQYVSIISLSCQLYFLHITHLHSNMFLLFLMKVKA